MIAWPSMSGPAEEMPVTFKQSSVMREIPANALRTERMRYAFPVPRSSTKVPMSYDFWPSGWKQGEAKVYGPSTRSAVSTPTLWMPKEGVSQWNQSTYLPVPGHLRIFGRSMRK
jgi:hypothetical protein